MKSPDSWQRKKLRSFKYKKTIFGLQSVFFFLSCCSVLVGLWLFFLHNTIRYDQHSTGIDNILRSYKAQLAFRSKERPDFSLLRSSTYSHDYEFGKSNCSSFGSVMSEFACRVLSRHITSSNILVIAPGAVLAAKDAFRLEAMKQLDSNDGRPQNNSIGSAFLRYGISEGHAIHAINSFTKEESVALESGVTLDSWWKSFEDGKNFNDVSKGWWSSEPVEKPNWIMLAVFDSDFGYENDVWKEAESFLEDCTVTYFVVAIHSIKRSDGSYEFGGTTAMDSLLRKKYKLQILSSSHYYTNADNARDILERYGPNALFQSVEKLNDYLRWGADAAERYGNPDDTVFTTYIFATQGLDLAIPAPQQYLQDAGRAIDVFDQLSMQNLSSLKSCPLAKSEEIDFVFNEVSCVFRSHFSKFFGTSTRFSIALFCGCRLLCI